MNIVIVDDEYIVSALKCGAKGYILKQDYAAIIPALEAVYSGQSVFGSEIISKLPSLLNQKPENLYLSEGTVRNYLSTILDKLGLRDRTQLAIFYYKHNKKTLLY